MKLTVSTREGAVLVGVTERSFHRWATDRGIQPERRQRIGRSTVTVWSIAAIHAGQKRRYAGQVTSERAEITTLPVECSNSEVA